jgi:hypothetical protein
MRSTIGEGVKMGRGKAEERRDDMTELGTKKIQCPWHCTATRFALSCHGDTNEPMIGKIWAKPKPKKDK